MDDHSKSLGGAVSTALANAAVSTRQSTQDLRASDERKRAFLETFRRWARLFRRKDSDVENDKWLIAEYYQSLGHLTPAGMDLLTEVLKEKCTFFPSIAECLAETKCSRWDWSHPFAAAERLGLFYPGSGKCQHALAAAERQAIETQAKAGALEYYGEKQ